MIGSRRAGPAGRRHRAQRPDRLGLHHRRRRPGRHLRRGDEPGGPDGVQGRRPVGADDGRPRDDRGEGREGPAGRAAVHPARPGPVPGRDPAPGVRPEVGRERAGRGGLPGVAVGGPGRRSEGVPRRAGAVEGAGAELRLRRRGREHRLGRGRPDAGPAEATTACCRSRATAGTSGPGTCRRGTCRRASTRPTAGWRPPTTTSCRPATRTGSATSSPPPYRFQRIRQVLDLEGEVGPRRTSAASSTTSRRSPGSPSPGC